MKKGWVYTLVVLAVLVVGIIDNRDVVMPGTNPPGGLELSVQSAYQNGQSDVQVQGEGTVRKILPDDSEGSRHQRFILQISDGPSLLVAHNIDLAPRVADLRTGDVVQFYGEYEWNSKGGVLHWTHHDPGGTHPDGWLKHEGHTYR